MAERTRPICAAACRTRCPEPATVGEFQDAVVARSLQWRKPAAPANARHSQRGASYGGFRHAAIRLAVVLGLLVLCACQSRTELHVFAASSLTDAFGSLEATFESAHPGVDVRLNTAGSQTLRLQIERGAPADVFASANPAHMEALRSAGLVESPAVFASNTMVVAVPESGMSGFVDLPRAQRIVLGAQTVPAGQYADAVIDAAGRLRGADFAEEIRDRVVSREPNVRLALAKVALGEADAALVYASDVRGRSGVRAVAIPAQLQPLIVYPVARVVGSPNPELATAWIEMLRSDVGRRALGSAGFGAAP